ncbi:MAG: NAD(P)H-binding protein [Pseudomonadota bacterium]
MGGKKRVLVFGASGTIGRAVASQLAADGYETVCFVRDGSGGLPELAPASLITGDVTDPASVSSAFAGASYDAVISCLASRTGAPRDAQAIDYQANLNVLEVAKAAGVRHFILLSAICVQRPLLAFQHAKLAFERELTTSGLTWSIVRPTAFFKSLSGQVERVRDGKPFMLFGDGELTRCKPISDADLARFITGCIDDRTRHNRVLPIGGPGPAISPHEQGEMLFELTGKEPCYRSVPVSMFSAAARLLSLGAPFSSWFAEKAEYARIARYYATESMLVFNAETGQYEAEATPEFGRDSLRDHYAELLGLNSPATEQADLGNAP